MAVTVIRRGYYGCYTCQGGYRSCTSCTGCSTRDSCGHLQIVQLPASSLDRYELRVPFNSGVAYPNGCVSGRRRLGHASGGSCDGLPGGITA